MSLLKKDNNEEQMVYYQTGMAFRENLVSGVLMLALRRYWDIYTTWCHWDGILFHCKDDRHDGGVVARGASFSER